jgi:arsenate reductase (thioredoxin)
VSLANAAAARKRVLFVCIGNACRSQMAEAFARAYGSDVILPASAGLAPAVVIPADTLRAMDEKNLSVRDQFPKALAHMGRYEFDLIVNMSGHELPAAPKGSVKEWDVPDPVYMRYEDHCRVRDRIEDMVMRLILDLRRANRDPGKPSAR